MGININDLTFQKTTSLEFAGRTAVSASELVSRLETRSVSCDLLKVKCKFSCLSMCVGVTSVKIQYLQLRVQGLHECPSGEDQ